MAGRTKTTSRLGLIALVALLAGCSSAYRENFDVVRQALHRSPKIAPTAADVAARPAFQMLVQAPGAQAVMVLGGVEGGQLDWYDGKGGGLFVRDGQVVRTIGLAQNLDDSRWISGNPFAQGLHRLQGHFTGSRVVDWSPGYRYGVRLDVRMTPAAMEDVSILGKVHHLRRIDEQISAPQAGFAASNHYWVDPADGLIWKSRQTVAPGIELQTLLLRPYREAAP